ncbi:ribosome small subunit-dependent GTPase A [Acanthopleuribacter pedis]|uniref:Small ribosomal subunit biogenesis GTPase RsgA n=1 Tax=Acanthopleuribacter pedis TaxID=442870 RepID=A0A8J7U1N8_9BACT|nr:ribosome small subunit-dependent GTPase A [Acanthopleuribacter pedis]MBO1317717.1 ribosome small subunit-dependent GTPase A [Acanthopleuribacter pedis]
MTSNNQLYGNQQNHLLRDWGFMDGVHSEVDNRLLGRVTAVHRGHWELATAAGSFRAVTAGRLGHQQAEVPVTGDWVVWHGMPGHDERLVIDQVLPRRTQITRKAAGTASAQVLVANVDWVWIVTSLNRDWNPARLERYLAMVWESGAKPAVVLSKCDLVDNRDDWIEKTEAVAFGAPIYPISAINDQGLDAAAASLQPGETVALLGSSGVGKSTLTNHLLARDRQETSAVRDLDQRGRHTTTHRELFQLPSGALLIDTPGLRELGLWTGEAAVAEVFAEVEALAGACRFRDCRHGNEPGCAVRAAMETGDLDQRRFDNYGKLQREVQRQEELQTASGRQARKQREKTLHKHIRQVKNR